MKSGGGVYMVPDGGSQVPLYGHEEPRNQSDLWAPEIPPSSDGRPRKSAVSGRSEEVSGLGVGGLEGRGLNSVSTAVRMHHRHEVPKRRRRKLRKAPSFFHLPVSL